MGDITFHKPITKIVIGGMGGSAIAGDLAADLSLALSARTAWPVITARDFHFPFTPDDETLAILCSYSGNTDETLALFNEAIKTRTRVMAIAGGGKLAKLAGQHNVPLLSVGLRSEPRHTVGYNLMLILGILNRLRLIELDGAAVSDSLEVLRQQLKALSHSTPINKNPAKSLASHLAGRRIVVCGSGIFGGVARRWKTQFNENSKAWAFFETLPELLHNTVEAFPDPLRTAPEVTLLVLKPNPLTPTMASRYAVLKELLDRPHVPNHFLEGVSGPPLTQVLSMMLLGDYVSYYLALLKGVDPSGTPTIILAKDLASQSSLPLAR